MGVTVSWVWRGVASPQCQVPYTDPRRTPPECFLRGHLAPAPAPASPWGEKGHSWLSRAPGEDQAPLHCLTPLMGPVAGTSGLGKSLGPRGCGAEAGASLAQRRGPWPRGLGMAGRGLPVQGVGWSGPQQSWTESTVSWGVGSARHRPQAGRQIRPQQGRGGQPGQRPSRNTTAAEIHLPFGIPVACSPKASHLGARPGEGISLPPITPSSGLQAGASRALLPPAGPHRQGRPATRTRAVASLRCSRRMLLGSWD